MIYDTIKEISLEKGLSISAIEKKAGLGNGTIAGWKNSDPKVSNLKAVAKVLGVSVTRLLN